jgi:hypothetical protein
MDQHPTSLSRGVKLHLPSHPSDSVIRLHPHRWRNRCEFPRWMMVGRCISVVTSTCLSWLQVKIYNAEVQRRGYNVDEHRSTITPTAGYEWPGQRVEGWRHTHPRCQLHVSRSKALGWICSLRPLWGEVVRKGGLRPDANTRFDSSWEVTRWSHPALPHHAFHGHRFLVREMRCGPGRCRKQSDTQEQDSEPDSDQEKPARAGVLAVTT